MPHITQKKQMLIWQILSNSQSLWPPISRLIQCFIQECIYSCYLHGLGEVTDALGLGFVSVRDLTFFISTFWSKIFTFPPPGLCLRLFVSVPYFLRGLVESVLYNRIKITFCEINYIINKLYFWNKYQFFIWHASNTTNPQNLTRHITMTGYII